MEENFYNCIYLLTSPTGRKYVGQTVNFNDRMKDYSLLNCKTQKRLFNELKKHGFENFTKTILFKDLKREDLNPYDIESIREHKTHSRVDRKLGLNLTEGGKGTLGFNHNQDSKNKMSKLKIGIFHKEEHKKKISDSLKLKYKNDPTYRNLMKLKRFPKKSGKEHCHYNHKIHTFKKEDHIFIGSRCELYTSNNLNPTNVLDLVNGKRKIVNGWSLVKG